FQHRLQIFLRGLLAEKATLVTKGVASPHESVRRPVVVFGFSHPLARRPFHRGLSPSTRSPCGTGRPPPSASSVLSACGRSDPSGMALGLRNRSVSPCSPGCTPA